MLDSQDSLEKEIFMKIRIFRSFSEWQITIRKNINKGKYKEKKITLTFNISLAVEDKGGFP